MPLSATSITTPAAVDVRRANPDPTVVGRIADGVVDEVVEHQTIAVRSARIGGRSAGMSTCDVERRSPSCGWNQRDDVVDEVAPTASGSNV